MLETILSIIIIFLVIFGFLYLIAPIPTTEFFNRIFGGQWFTFDIKRKDHTLSFDIDAKSEKEEEIEEAEKQLPPMTNEIRELAGIPVKTPEVYLVQDNIYTYNDAEALCAAYNAKLATVEDLYVSWKDGANWCNYGWLKGKKIGFPTQKNSWLKLQSDDDTKNMCGLPGINVGTVRDPNARYGVHCKGVKPAVWKLWEANTLANTVLTAKQQAVNSRARFFRKRLNNYTVTPFSDKKWSDTYVASDFNPTPTH